MEEPSHPAGRTSPTGIAILDLPTIALVGIVVAALAGSVDGWRGPVAHDEFSALLAGETIAAGRFANAPHALPRFFDTFHVLQEPTYASKYFPAPGLFLALGIVLGGSARLGQWMAFGCMAAAMLWCLRGWVGRGTAWVTSLAAVLLLADTPWASGFWGAPLACAGAAMALGASGRLSSGPRVITGLTAGAGAALLALTRPWEGLWTSIPLAAVFLAWIAAARGEELHRRLRRVALPAVAALVAGGALLAAHSAAITGSWRLPAYVRYEQASPGAPPFIWQVATPAPDSMRATTRERYRADMLAYTNLRQQPLRTLGDRAASSTRYYGGFGLLGVVLLVMFVPRRRRTAIAAASLVAGCAAVSVSSFFTPNYLAPIIPPVAVLAALGAQALWDRNGPWRLIPGGALAVALTFGVINLATRSPAERRASDPTFWVNRRALVARQLEATPGRHVVFVHYAPTYRDRYEWVQNPADRDAARVIWVHDLGEEANAQFLDVEPGRTAWRLALDQANGSHPPSLEPYTPCASERAGDAGPATSPSR